MTPLLDDLRLLCASPSVGSQPKDPEDGVQDPFRAAAQTEQQEDDDPRDDADDDPRDRSPAEASAGGRR